MVGRLVGWWCVSCYFEGDYSPGSWLRQASKAIKAINLALDITAACRTPFVISNWFYIIGCSFLVCKKHIVFWGEELEMPEISRFYGIAVRMFYEAGRHHQPHFHAIYGEYLASFAIDPPALLAGTMPRRQMHLILA